jgi:phage-related protein
MALGFNIGTEEAPEVICPDKNLKIVSQPRVLSVNFGDGYGQTIKDGVYSRKETYEITLVNRTAEEIDRVISFFETNKGVYSFEYTLRDDPLEVVSVICEEYNVIYTNRIASGCIASFRQVRN